MSMPGFTAEVAVARISRTCYRARSAARPPGGVQASLEILSPRARSLAHCVAGCPRHPDGSYDPYCLINCIETYGYLFPPSTHMRAVSYY